MTALAELVWGRCQTRRLTGVTVTIKVKYNDFRQIVRGRTEAEPVRDAADLAHRAINLLAPCFPVPRGIRLLGVTVSGLRQGEEISSPRQLMLFSQGM